MSEETERTYGTLRRYDGDDNYYFVSGALVFRIPYLEHGELPEAGE